MGHGPTWNSIASDMLEVWLLVLAEISIPGDVAAIGAPSGDHLFGAETGLAHLIDWSWPGDAAHADLHCVLYQGVYGGPASKVFEGTAPPPEAFDLLPGPYFLMVARDVGLQWRRFEVESGQEVQVESGPELGNN